MSTIKLLMTGAIVLICLPQAWGVSKSAGVDTKDSAQEDTVHVVVFDFATVGKEDPRAGTPLSGSPEGMRLADSIRLKLRSREGYEVVDRFTTREFSGSLGIDTGRDKVADLMNKLAVNLAVYGSVQKRGRSVRAELGCIDLRIADEPGGWEKVFTDDTERHRAVIAKAVVEAITERSGWTPPQYGDETEPERFGNPLNTNGSFDAGCRGWDRPDNVGTFLIKGPKDRGMIFKAKTDLNRATWLEYRKKLRAGKADPNNPPEVPRDTSYGSVAALEGVHYRSEWIKATPGQRYWLTADKKGPGGAKVFVKGFKDTADEAQTLPENALRRMGMTPEQFAQLPRERQKTIIAAEARRYPEKYRRKNYRWYLNCAKSGDGWKHFAAPFPPRGGLPDNVRWLRIEIYSYWPPGEYFWDEVHLYKEPRRKTPPAEEKPRTPNTDG